MKKIISVASLILAMAWGSTAPAYAGNGCLTLDGIYSRYMTDNFMHKNGMGGSLMLEWQPIDFWSIGAGADALFYFGTQTPGITSLESVNLVTRIIFNMGDPFTVYLIGAGGINPKLDLGTDLQWGGDYHLMGGLGTWIFISPMTAFDVSVVYDYYNQSLLPPTDSMQAINARVGLSFFFENAQKKGEAKAAATSEAQPAPTQVVSEAAPAPTTEIPAPETQAAAPAAETPAPVVETPAPAAEAAAPAPEAETAAPAPAAETAAAPATQAAPAEGEIEVLKKTQPETTAEAPVTHYSVIKGDCLWIISGKDSIYGDSFKWPLIFQANRDQIADPDLIYPKQDFSIRRDYTQEEADKARQKASDTPKYVPHTMPRESLPVDYF